MNNTLDFIYKIPIFSVVCILIGLLLLFFSISKKVKLKDYFDFDLDVHQTKSIRGIGITLLLVGILSCIFIPSERKTVKQVDWLGKWEIMYEGQKPIQYDDKYPYYLELKEENGRIIGEYELPEGKKGDIFNININGSYLNGKYRGYFSGGELEFILTEDKKSFLGRYLRTTPKPGTNAPYPADGKYRFWLGRKK